MGRRSVSFCSFLGAPQGSVPSLAARVAKEVDLEDHLLRWREGQRPREGRQGPRLDWRGAIVLEVVGTQVVKLIPWRGSAVSNEDVTRQHPHRFGRPSAGRSGPAESAKWRGGCSWPVKDWASVPSMAPSS